MDTVHFYKDEADQFRWRRVSENGRIVANSGEGYVRLQSAIDIARDMFGETVRFDYSAADSTPVETESSE